MGGGFTITPDRGTNRPSRHGKLLKADLRKGDSRGPSTGETISCPNCTEISPTPEAYSVHLQRHMEVDPPKHSPRGKVLSTPCPKGCGRNFAFNSAGNLSADARFHIDLCDGSSPIVKGEKPVRTETKEEELMAGLDCPKCGKKYQRGGARRDKHVKKCKGKERAAARRAKPAAASPAPDDASLSEHLSAAIEELKTRRGGLIAEIEKIDKRIETLEAMTGEA